MTVLFCDLANSTEIAEPLDPEEYRELLDVYLEVAIGAIASQDGVVNQLAGDGLMALFGAPIAREDAPERAVAAGLAIQAALRQVADERLARRGLELEARIGIHTGLAVVGTVGTDAKMDYTAIGDTTNLASRLESLAQPGSILVSEATRQLIGDLYRVERVGPFEVKGKTEPVIAFRVCCTSGADDLAPTEGQLTPFVGRDGYLAQLEDAFRRVDTGLTQMVAVVGEAGSGKSRLIHEFKRRIPEGAATILEARCSSLTQNMPDYVWIAMLERHFAIQPQDTPQARREKLADGLRRYDPDLDRLYPYVSRLLQLESLELRELSAEEIRHKTFSAVGKLFGELTRERPLILLVEDLHWIDESSRRDLELAAAKMVTAPVLLLVSHRPEYQPRWQARASFTQLQLGPLADRDTARIVEHRAGGSVPQALLARLLEKAEGNPFYAEEITRVLVDSGDLTATDGRVLVTRPVEEVPIPNTVTELLGARLDRLPAAAKRVAQAASVIGREFRPEPVEHLLAGEGLDVAAGLAELERRGVVYTGGDLRKGVFRFGESLTQEVAYESLLLRERRRLHGEVARQLDAKGEPGPERAALLAHHWARSDDRGRALRALLVAAIEAESVPVYPAMARFQGQAWELARSWLASGEPQSDADLRAVLQAAIGAIRVPGLAAQTGGQVGREAFETGRQLAERLGDDVALVELLAYYGSSLANDDSESFPEGVRLLERACEVAHDADLAVPALRATRLLGWSYFLDARIDDGLRLLDEAVTGFEELGHRDSLSDAYLGTRSYRDRVLFWKGPLERAEEQTRETLELAERASNRTIEGASLGKLARLALERGDPGLALESAVPAIELGREIGNVGGIRGAAAVAAISQAELGGRAAPSVLDALEQGCRPEDDVAVDAEIVSEAMLAGGGVERTLALIQDRKPAGRLRELLIELAQARVRARMEGGVEAARAAAEHVLAEAERLQIQPLRAQAALTVAEIALVERELGTAGAHIARTLEAAEAAGLTRLAGRASALLARAKGPSQPEDLH